jgi:8-oxo-dGTP pyrophosphatase MutT (NUDIX family)
MPYLNAQITTQAIIKNSKNDILLLKRSKPGGWFTLPGGTVEEGEDIKTCLEREILEETGLKTEINSPVWVWQSNHIGKDLLGIVFNIENIVPDDTKIKLSPEHDEYRWFSIDELFLDDKVDPYIKKDELRRNI